jgi:hypothetical protein
VLALGTDEGIEDGENVTTIFDHAREYVTELRFAFGVLVPLGENRRRNLNVAAEFFRGMSAEEQPVKESSLALRESKIRYDISRQNGSNSGHSKNAVYSKSLRRQVEHRFQCRQPVKAGAGMDATEGRLTGSNRT